MTPMSLHKFNRLSHRDFSNGAVLDEIAHALAEREEYEITLKIIRDERNEFEGPSLDYMQGYRDGQKHLQDIAITSLEPPRKPEAANA